MSVRAVVGKNINRMLRPLKVQLVSGYSTDGAIKSFLPAKKTIAAARGSGLSIGAYIDQAFVEPGATPKLVAEMLQLAELPPGGRVCEIGAGSGRYSEEVINALHPDSYEIYETALDWLPHLRSLPNAVVRDANGRTLSQTDDLSVDFVHAQKTFVYLDTCVVISYLEEMVRVVRPGGIVAFDVVTEDCLDDETARAWVRYNSTYRLCSRAWVTGYLRRRDLILLGSCFTPLPPGKSELLVFRRVRMPEA